MCPSLFQTRVTRPSAAQLRADLPRMPGDLVKQAPSVRVHRDDAAEILDFEMPAGLGRAELLEVVDAGDARDARRGLRRRAADRLHVDAAVLLHRRERRGVHAALADDDPNARLRDEARLVGILAVARGGAGGLDGPGRA